MATMAWVEHCVSLLETSDYTSSAVCDIESMTLYAFVGLRSIIIASYFPLSIRPVCLPNSRNENNCVMNLLSFEIV